MKTYLRILGYAKPYTAKIVSYILSTLLYVVFSGLAFYMIQPMLQLLFHPPVALPAAVPHFGFSINGLRAWVEYEGTWVSTHVSRSTALLYVTLFIVGLNLAGNIFKFLSSRTMGTIRTRVVEDMREDAYSKLIKLPVKYLENERKGDIIGRITSDMIEVEHSVVVTFESIIRDPFNIIYILYLMIMESWRLTLFIFIVLPLSATLISRITKTLKRDAKDTQHLLGRILSIVDETIGGIRIIKAFNAESYIKKVFDKLNQSHSRITRIQWHKKALVPIFSESAMVLVVGLTLWYGGNLVFSGHMKDSAFITYISMFYLVSRPAKSLSQAFGNIYKGLASGERIFGLMDTPLDITESAAPTPVKEFNHQIEIRDVSFAYVKEPVLKHIELNIEKGKIYALVGPSGSGKSTLAELLLRFYDPTEGSILIDGVNLKDMATADLRALTAVVTQEAILFNDTIYNNIAFGMPHVTEQQVLEAAKAANAHNFIMETEQGYQTNIGDRGGLLSGGQRQRLSIARAILKNPPILILDEATSALDTSSEKIVQDALYTLMAHRTSIVIAHRLSTIQDADEIIVLDKGVIAERGSHQQLIASNGLYKSLYQLQQLETGAVEILAKS